MKKYKHLQAFKKTASIVTGVFGGIAALAMLMSGLFASWAGDISTDLTYYSRATDYTAADLASMQSAAGTAQDVATLLIYVCLAGACAWVAANLLIAYKKDSEPAPVENQAAPQVASVSIPENK